MTSPPPESDTAKPPRSAFATGCLIGTAILVLAVGICIAAISGNL